MLIFENVSFIYGEGQSKRNSGYKEYGFFARDAAMLAICAALIAASAQ
jgi:hypothetical protein